MVVWIFVIGMSTTMLREDQVQSAMTLCAVKPGSMTQGTTELGTMTVIAITLRGQGKLGVKVLRRLGVCVSVSCASSATHSKRQSGLQNMEMWCTD